MGGGDRRGGGEARWQRVVYKLRTSLPLAFPRCAGEARPCGRVQKGGSCCRPPPGEVSLTKRWGGGHPGGGPSSLPPVRERSEPCVSPGPRRACPAAAAAPVRCRAAPPLRDRSTFPAALPGALPAPSPASSWWGGLRWGSLRQRQTKAERRALPPPPGLGSAAHLPAGGGDALGAGPDKAAGAAECVRVRFANRN